MSCRIVLAGPSARTWLAPSGSKEGGRKEWEWKRKAWGEWVGGIGVGYFHHIEVTKRDSPDGLLAWSHFVNTVQQQHLEFVQQIGSGSGWHRVYQPELAIATAGEWDPVLRKLRLVPSRDPIWAFNYTSSERAPGGAFWLPSGAGHFNQFAYEAVRLDIFFNEVSS